MKIIPFVSILLLFITFSSCDFEEPEFSNFGNFKLIQLDGQKAKVSFDIQVENENAFGFKIKRGKLDLNLNNQPFGLIQISDKIKIKRKSNNVLTIPLTIDLNDGALVRIIQLSKSNSIEVEIDGKIRGSVFGFGKTFRVNEKKTISGSQLGMP